MAVNGVTRRMRRCSAATNGPKNAAIPTVEVALPDTRAPNTQRSTCRAGSRPHTRALFMRASTATSSWKADIGARVKAGQLLGGDRRAGPRPADHAGAGRPHQRPGQRSLAQVEPRARPGPDPSGAVSRQDRDQRRPTQAAKALVKSSAGQSRALWRVLRIQAHRGAVRRHRHGSATPTSARSSMRVGRRAGAVRRLRHQLAARPRQRAADLRAEHPGRHQGADLGSRVSGRMFAATVEASSQSVDMASGTTRMQLVVENTAGR